MIEWQAFAAKIESSWIGTAEIEKRVGIAKSAQVLLHMPRHDYLSAA